VTWGKYIKGETATTERSGDERVTKNK
jgi:hypothetical protein